MNLTVKRNLLFQMYTEENLTNPTSRDVVLETARYMRYRVQTLGDFT